MRPPIASLFVAILLSSCGERAASPSNAATASQPPASKMPASDTTTQLPAATSTGLASTATIATPAGADAPAFVDKVWRVGPATGVEAGTTYTFLHDGTLRIDAPHGTPANGRWRYTDGRLTMIEDGIAYPTDIVSLDATHFVIRSHNPGGVVEIAMTADTRAPLPHP